MKWAIDGKGKAIALLSWCEVVEDSAMKQAIDLTIHPTTFHHVALMPDCHPGYGMPIGGVIACQNAVIPNAVGVDIGCGMCAVSTDFLAADITVEQIKQMMGIIRENVPVGFSHRNIPVPWSHWDNAPDIPIVQAELGNARGQLGTLGGGNHFIEIQAGDDGNIWLMLHSGSRNFGYKIAKTYHEKAIELCTRYKSDIPCKDLAFLPIDTEEAQEYLTAMNFALEFAAENRRVMMQVFREAAHSVLGCSLAEEEINIHHNYAAIENHFKHNVWIHRKGATSARKGQRGIIPGSMGTPSYIVEGLGNPDSFTSCSHGAGRTMGRAEASRRLTVEECDAAMEGIVYGRWGKGRRSKGRNKGNVDLGEAPQAYKDIDEVMEAQTDLVKPLVKLRPLGVIKG